MLVRVKSADVARNAVSVRGRALGTCAWRIDVHDYLKDAMRLDEPAGAWNGPPTARPVPQTDRPLPFPKVSVGQLRRLAGRPATPEGSRVAYVALTPFRRYTALALSASCTDKLIDEYLVRCHAIGPTADGLLASLRPLYQQGAPWARPRPLPASSTADVPGHRACPCPHGQGIWRSARRQQLASCSTLVEAHALPSARTETSAPGTARRCQGFLGQRSASAIGAPHPCSFSGVPGCS
jgi:hypothetical protein